MFVSESSALPPRLKLFGLTFGVTSAVPSPLPPSFFFFFAFVSSLAGSSCQRRPISDQNRRGNQMVRISTDGGHPANRGRGCT